MRNLLKPLLWLVLVFTSTIVFAAGAQPAIRVYWTEWRSYSPTHSRIARAEVNGDNVEGLLNGFHADAGLKDLAIDTAAGKLYWANKPAGLIERANLDGTDRQTVLDPVSAVGLALDPAANRIYWTDYTYANPRIRRAFLDGTGVEDLVSASVGCQLEGIALDLASGHLYWAERLDQQIWRANLDGSGATLILQCWEGVGHPWGLAVDGNRLYWASGRAIITSDKQGANVTPLVTDLPDSPRSLELDLVAGRLYWVTGDMWNASVQCVRIDGSDLQTLVTGLNYGYGIALEFGLPVTAPEVVVLPALLTIAPNPFNPTTRIGFDLAQAQHARLQVLALDGTVLRTLLEGPALAGRHEVAWDGRDRRGRLVSAGVYIGVLTTEQGQQTGRMSLVR